MDQSDEAIWWLASADQLFQEIRRWLDGPDPSENFNQAIKNRYDGTGRWFVEGKQYQRWKNDASSFIWLYGIPGCGKTILSSTVIQDLERQGKVVAYFYFDFKDSQKQTPILLIKSLILQLCQPNRRIPPAIETLYSSCANGEKSPSLDGLLHVLRETIQELPESYVVIDALDECVYRDDLIDVLNTICGWGSGNLHLLATSRKERDIEMCLEELVAPDNAICLKTEVVDVDIRHYVAHILDTRRKFEKWRKDDNMRREIETALMQKSKGMFRALGSLPATLDETYDRILLSIDEEHSEYALRILTWLAFSARPLFLSEVAEVVAVDTDNGLDPGGVLEDPMDVMAICSTLVTITAPREKRFFQLKRKVVEETVVLVHYSVKEYLLSDRIQQGLASRFALKPIACEIFIAKGCLRYLLQLRDSVSCSAKQLIEKPKLAGYAAEFWVYHARAVGPDSDTMNRLIIEFLISFARLPEIVRLLIRVAGVDVNAISEGYGTPLCAAVHSGDRSMVSTLLQEGADLNGPPNPDFRPLSTAAGSCKTEIVELLLQAGPRVETLSRALGVAAFCGHAEVAEMLLRNGANVNLECSTFGGLYYSALQAAAGGGWKGMVELLLQAGADVNMQTESNHSNALKAAIKSNEREMMQLLFQAGVDVHAKCHSDCDDALTFAVKWGKRGVIRLMLKAGADVNGSNALEVATSKGHLEAMALLLQAGANTNVATTVGEAVREDYLLEATKLLLQPGREAGYNIALAEAAERGHLEAVRLLLQAGTDANECDALEDAAKRGDLDVMRLLLQAGADCKGDCGEWALDAASTCGHEDMVKLLLANGAGIWVEEGRYDEAMQAASDGKYVRAVRLLLSLSSSLVSFRQENGAYKEVAELLLQAALAKKQDCTDDERGDSLFLQCVILISNVGLYNPNLPRKLNGLILKRTGYEPGISKKSSKDLAPSIDVVQNASYLQPVHLFRLEFWGLNDAYDASILGNLDDICMMGTEFVLVIIQKSHITSTTVCNLTIQRFNDSTTPRLNVLQTNPTHKLSKMKFTLLPLVLLASTIAASPAPLPAPEVKPASQQEVDDWANCVNDFLKADVGIISGSCSGCRFWRCITGVANKNGRGGGLAMLSGVVSAACVVCI
ncbi:hypothetical protein FQN55_004738 [Onygenales sp. PD_40]|nr:hypothetical protein FQN55_004738 [Onygenales sp. PD_40]